MTLNITKIKFNEDKLIFVNFFRKKDNDKEEVEKLECELTEQYGKYSLNTYEGGQNRMDYASKNDILLCQLGNTSTYLFKDIDKNIIYGFNTSLADMLLEVGSKNIDTILNEFKEETGYFESKYTEECWYPDWKNGIEKTCQILKDLENTNLKHYGSICNEMWRIMATTPSIIKKHDLIEDQYNEQVEIDIQEGTYLLESDYCSDNPIHFTLTKV